MTDAPDAIFAAGRRVFAGDADGVITRGLLELRVLRSSPFKGGLIVAFEGITDKTNADTWRDHAGGGYQAGWTGEDPGRVPVTVTMVVRTSEAGVALRPEQFGTEPLRCRPP